MKLQHIAAAVALAAAGASHAAMDITGGATNGSGNGNLVLVAFDNTGGSNTAGIFDLGLTMQDFFGNTSNNPANGFAAGSLAASADTDVVWDFNANTIKVNGTVTSFGGTNDWTAAWTKLLANVDLADLQFTVMAFDATGIGSAKHIVHTADRSQTAAALTAQDNSVFGTVMQVASTNNIISATNARGTHPTAGNGAYTFVASIDGATTLENGYVMAGNGYANNARNGMVLAGAEAAANSTTTALWMLYGGGGELVSLNNIRLDVAAGQLVYGTPAVTPAVPEPTSLALVITGLAVAGAVARRRRAA